MVKYLKSTGEPNVFEVTETKVDFKTAHGMSKQNLPPEYIIKSFHILPSISLTIRKRGWSTIEFAWLMFYFDVFVIVYDIVRYVGNDKNV